MTWGLAMIALFIVADAYGHPPPSAIVRIARTLGVSPETVEARFAEIAREIDQSPRLTLSVDDQLAIVDCNGIEEALSVLRGRGHRGHGVVLTRAIRRTPGRLVRGLIDRDAAARRAIRRDRAS